MPIKLLRGPEYTFRPAYLTGHYGADDSLVSLTPITECVSLFFPISGGTSAGTGIVTQEEKIGRRTGNA